MCSLNPLPSETDQTKLLVFADKLDKIELPAVVGAEALIIIRDARESLEYLAKAIRIKTENL